MNYTLEIQKILLKVEKLTTYKDKVQWLKEAIAIADKNNDIEWGFDLRVELINNEIHTASSHESFQAFAWLLDICDTYPEEFNDEEILWEYKWMVGSAYRNTRISFEQIEYITEDLKRRLEKNGYTLRAYYNVMSNWRRFAGKEEEAQQLIQLVEQESRDDMSNCEACETDAKVGNLLKLNQTEKALEEARPLMEDRLSCYAVPFRTFATLAYELLLQNHPQAGEFYQKALDADDPEKDYQQSELVPWTKLMFYQWKTGTGDAWKQFENNTQMEYEAEDDLKLFFAQHALPMLKNEDSLELNISSRQPYYQANGVYKAQDLYDYYKKQAEDLAKGFDARENTTYFSDTLQHFLAY